mmetsp:Transcript_11641/g.17921  ORF Transcript_11641/g.17921 Transcript_11641/m.17921 type:complete len:233 (-) Transcript_11641:773-1471(-)
MLFPDDGADIAEAGGIRFGCTAFPTPELPTPDMPPPPNLAAMRALASSRSLVCLITYCSSLSPLSRSIPLGSSPGPGLASVRVDCEDIPPPPERKSGVGAGAAPPPNVLLLLLGAAPPPLIILSEPNPEYLLFGLALLCEWNCRCKSSNPSLPPPSGAVTEFTKLDAPELNPPQKLDAVVASSRRVPSSCTVAATVVATVLNAPKADPNPDITEVVKSPPPPTPMPYPELGL